MTSPRCSRECAVNLHGLKQLEESTAMPSNSPRPYSARRHSQYYQNSSAVTTDSEDAEAANTSQAQSVTNLLIDDVSVACFTCTFSNREHYINEDDSQFVDIMSPLQESTSEVLERCKRKVLHPYFRILAMLGWRPLVDPNSEEIPMPFHLCNFFYTLTVLSFIILGYTLQYAACFRRDGFSLYMGGRISRDATNLTDTFSENEGNSYNSKKYPKPCISLEVYDNKTCRSSTGVYVLPDLIHLVAYLYVWYQMRNPRNELLQTLMEKVFLQSSVFQAWHLPQRTVIQVLRAFLGFGFGWTILSTGCQLLHVCTSIEINFTWMEPSGDVIKKVLYVLMLATLMWNDIICVAIVMSYAVHCQLIIVYIQNLCNSIREKNISFLGFYKEIQEAVKFVRYLNRELAAGVSLIIFVIGCESVVAAYGLFTLSTNRQNWYILTSTVLELLLWIALMAFPVLQAMRLTDICRSTRKLGHEIRARPFGYQDTPQQDLDSLLIFCSSLHLEAKLFSVPVKSSSVALVVSTSLFLILVLGQIDVLHLGP